MMAEDKIEEETYSLIFTSLKHPIRRRILRMLADGPLTYSEILEILNIDSGHLSYHLESLGDLTVHDKNGHYQLSSFGVATVKLMGGVEEQTPSQSHRKFKLRRILAKVYPVILVLALIGASFHFVTYATLVSSTTVSTDQLFPPPLYIATGQTFEVNVTLDQWSSNIKEGIGVYRGPKAYMLALAPLKSTLTGWEEASVWIESRVNQTQTAKESVYSTYAILTKDNFTLSSSHFPIQWFNETGLSNENFTFHMKIFTNTTDATGTAFKISAFFISPKLLVDVHTPNGTVLADSFQWTSTAFRSDRVSSPSVSVTEPGTYLFSIRNDAPWDWDGFLSVNLQLQRFEKPYFYWGVAGFIIALGYVAVVTAVAYRARQARHKD
jgi:DNA-binding transcriptional ArsR family regulator